MIAILKPALDSASKQLLRWGVLIPLFWLPQDRRIGLERWLRGREQYSKLNRADVVIVSFGKSGRTWLRVMLSRFYQVKHGLSDRLLIGFDNMHLRNRAIPKIFFTHDNYTRDYTGSGTSKRDYYSKRVVLLVRHPADVAISQFHQWKFRMRKTKKSLNEYPAHGRDVPLYDFVVKERAGLDKAIFFLNEWAKELPRLDHVLIVRYEDMRQNPKGVMKQITDFMGTPGTEEEVAEAVEFASFENMRKLEERNAFWLAGGRISARDKSNPESFKTRRGKAGGWRSDFSEEQVAEIERVVEARLLPGFGYLRSEQSRQEAIPA